MKEEYEDEPLELELENDGNLRMSTLISQFSGACGLRFRNKETGAMRKRANFLPLENMQKFFDNFCEIYAKFQFREQKEIRLAFLVFEKFRKSALNKRGVRVHNDLFLPPNGADGWPRDVTFNVVYTRDTREVKRKMGEPQVKGLIFYFSN